MKKSTVTEIKERFDNDVERFSNLNTGQVATVDAAISLELVTETVRRMVPKAKYLLDIGCGAGNYTLKMLSKIPDLHCTLNDLSAPMLERAKERLNNTTAKSITTIQGDIREVQLEEDRFCVIVAGAVLHHLRDDKDWEATFANLYKILKPGGCLMISDLITQEIEPVNEYMWERYADYLEDLNGKAYQQKVFDYIAKEDSPRSMTYQLELMKKVGFKKTEILHKNMCFGTFCGVK